MNDESVGVATIGIVDRLERLPMTSYQKTIFIIIATAWLFDSMDLGMMTFILGSIKAEFGLSTSQAGLLASSSFFGMFIGAAISGLLADRFGRRIVFQWSMVLWGMGSILCALAGNVTTLMLFRVLLGIGMGMEFPVGQAMLSEIMPAGQRGRYTAFLEGFWPIGFICAGLTAYFLLPVGGWRGVFFALGIPAIFVLVIRQFVPESPRWLESRGRHKDADQVMTKIEAKVRNANGGKPLPEIEASTILYRHGQGRSGFKALWAPGYAKRTFMVWSLWFFALLGYYGLTTWLGALLQQAGYPVTKSVFYTLLISLAGVPGFLTSAWLVESWGRKPTCVLMLLGSACMAYLYGNTAAHVADQTQLIVFGLGMQFFMFGMWSVLYAYTPELYPTRCRATGGGFASCVGRIGSLIGPYVVGIILPVAGQSGVFGLGASCFVIAALVVLFLGIETKGKVLEEISA
ncbi:MAG: MFS transporter [Ferrovum sp.]|nr:MFS transporter [Ferrovum sp.]